MISVVIPVGPNPVYKEYLQECLDSVWKQTVQPKEVLIIDDQAHLSIPLGPRMRIWKTPWLSGVAHAFNFGVALAQNKLVLMLGSDDKLEPWCIEDCVAAYRQRMDSRGYYYLDVRYSDGETQNLACHAAMVTKDLWNHNGGFPVESAVGAPDTILISMMIAAGGAAGRLWHVESKKPPYWYRRHAETETARRQPLLARATHEVRAALTGKWEKPLWTT